MQRDIVRLGGLTVGVPDPAATADFLETALDLYRHRDGNCEHLTTGGDYGFAPPRALLTLTRRPELQLETVRLELAAGHDLTALRSRLEIAQVPAEVDTESRVEFRDPDGILLVCSRTREELEAALPPSAIRPRRLGHVNLKVPDSSASARFYSEVVGLALSEQVGDLLYFFRAGSDHHNVGIRGNAALANVHHIAFEIPGWDYYRPFCDRLVELGQVVEYGPGRHGPGNNLFVYLVDPSSQLRVELFADMAHIDDDDSYEPKRWESTERARTMNRWGPAPPESFLH